MVDSVWERFWAKVRIDPGTDCWIWTAYRNPKGYGVFSDGKNWGAHRWAYTQKHGPVPDGLVLDHFVCDNPSCVNPDHVRPTTNKANALRGRGPTALNARKTLALELADHCDDPIHKHQIAMLRSDREALEAAHAR